MLFEQRELFEQLAHSEYNEYSETLDLKVFKEILDHNEYKVFNEIRERREIVEPCLIMNDQERN